MVNEAVSMFETSLPIPFICADATAINYGTILKLADPFTVSASSGAADLVGGIAAEEKIASNGVKTIATFRSGIFKVKISGNVTVGDPLVTDSAANYLKSQITVLSGNKIFGVALETGTTNESILMELMPQNASGLTA